MARKRARPEDEAFLSAIIEAPDDDAPRLVYADWLEEHGQAEADRARAEFIREQIRLLREGGASGRYSEGSERLRDLRHEHRSAWEQSLPRWAAHRGRYYRGFIEGVTGTARQLLQDGERLRQMIPLRRLHLERPDGFLDEVAASGLLAGLRWFAIDGVMLAPEELRALAGCRDLEGLTCLRMGRCRLGRSGAEILAGASWLAGVETLYLIGNAFGPEGARSLAAVAFRRLADLNLQANYIGDEGAAALMDCPHVPAHLAALNLRYNDLGPAGASALGRCASLRGLCRLELANNALGDEGARALAASPHLAGLEELELREARITDAGAAALAGSPHLAGLTTLDLYDNPIVGEGIYTLLESPHLKGLTSLSIISPRRRQDEAALRAVSERFDKKR